MLYSELALPSSEIGAPCVSGVFFLKPPADAGGSETRLV